MIQVMRLIMYKHLLMSSKIKKNKKNRKTINKRKRNAREIRKGNKREIRKGNESRKQKVEIRKQKVEKELKDKNKKI